jgi:hypothetical protein
MARDKKFGVYFNGKISEPEYTALIKYSEETGLTKTAVVEKALNFYISNHLKGKMSLEEYVKSEMKSYDFVVGNSNLDEGSEDSDDSDSSETEVVSDDEESEGDLDET